MSAVYAARKKYYPDDPYSTDAGRFWDAVDWSKSNDRIIQETGASYSTVNENRYRYDKECCGSYSQKEEAARVYRAYLEKHGIRQQLIRQISWLYK